MALPQRHMMIVMNAIKSLSKAQDSKSSKIR